MNGPDCPECGMHFLECHCNKKKKRRTAVKGSIIVEPTYQELNGNLHDIPNETLYKFLEENETRNSAFLAIVCSEILRRQGIEKAADLRFWEGHQPFIKGTKS